MSSRWCSTNQQAAQRTRVEGIVLQHAIASEGGSMRWQKTPVLPPNSTKRFRSAREDTRPYTSRTQIELVVQAARLSRKFGPSLPITGNSEPAASVEWTVEAGSGGASAFVAARRQR